MPVEAQIAAMCEYADAIVNPMVGEHIRDFGDLILEAVKAERTEWRKKEVEWERRIKLAGSMTAAKQERSQA